MKAAACTATAAPPPRVLDVTGQALVYAERRDLRWKGRDTAQAPAVNRTEK